MINNVTYEKLLLFQKKLLEIHFNHPYDITFMQQVQKHLHEIFGYKSSLMVYLGYESKRSIPSTFMTHNVNIEFAQRFHSEYLKEEAVYIRDTDTFLFSSNDLHNKSDENYLNCEKLLRRFGFVDFIIRFLKFPNEKRDISCIILFSEKKLFNNEDVEIINALQDSIALAQYNYTQLFKLKTNNDTLVNLTSYFPMGIITVSNFNHVTFINDLAKKYLSELGIIDPAYYDTFYSNSIYKHIQHDIVKFGSNKLIKLNNYLFSIVNVSNPSASFIYAIEASENTQSNFQQGLTSALMNVSICIFIISDTNTTHIAYSQSSFDELDLTKRERIIVEHISNGLSNKQIAEEMILSTNTVKVHISNILHKANVKNRIELLNKLRFIDSKNDLMTNKLT